ncbi:MAG: hypothetical protein HYY18_18855 [Planctomycetes bacterium]|nr:hypothetical protein [Planctomycetota bacterium]
MRPLTLALVTAALLSALGCRRSSDDDSSSVNSGSSGSGSSSDDCIVAWSASSASVNEGASVSLDLILDESCDLPVEISFSTSDSARVRAPATIFIPAGSTSVSVTIETVGDADAEVNEASLSASTSAGASVLAVVVTDDDLISGPIGPVGPLGVGVAGSVSAGADGTFGTADDSLIVAYGIGAEATSSTSVVIGPVSPGPHTVPVATGIDGAVLIMTNGPDATLGTADDLLIQVQGIPAAPSVTASVAVGPMEASLGRRPVMVGSRAVIASRGTDGATSLDDRLVVVTGIGTAALNVVFVAMAGLAFEAPSIPERFDDDSILITTSGPDFAFGTGDEVMIRVRDIGVVPVAVSLVTGRIPGDFRGQPLAVSATTAAVVSAGVDGSISSLDDELLVVRDLLVSPDPALPVVVGAVTTDIMIRAVAPGGDIVLIATLGAALLDPADDEIVLVGSLSSGGILPPTPLPDPRPRTGLAGRILGLSSSVAVRLNNGPDGSPGTDDDALTIFSGLDAAAGSSQIATGAAADFAPMDSAGLSAALVGEGPDGTLGTADDLAIRISGLGSSPLVVQARAGALAFLEPPALVQLTGGGQAMVGVVAGPDGLPGTPDDVLIVARLP